MLSQGILQGVLIGSGVIALIAGLWLVRARHADPNDQARGHRPRMARPTTMVLGIASLIVGYHLLAYGLPAGWLTGRVPVDRLWMLGVGIAVAVGASLVLDLVEHRQDQRSGEPDDTPSSGT